MSHTRKFIQSFLTYLLLLSFVLLLIQPESASAQTKDGIKRQVDPETGKVNFISSTNGRPLAASQVLGFVPNRAADPALAIAQHFGHEFGLANAGHELTVVRSGHAENGRMTVRYQQKYQDIPVLAGELIVNTNDQGDFYSMNGEVAPNLSLPTQPTIDPEQASEIALQATAKWYRKTTADFIASTPTLWVFDESLLKPSQRPAELVWRMEVSAVDPFAPVRELVLVNAQRGSVSLHFNQIDAGLKDIGTFESSSSAYVVHASGVNADGSASPLAVSPTGGYRKTYTANHGETLPGTLLCTQTTAICTNGSNPDADLAHMYAAETWNFFHDHHGRDSIDNQSMTIISTVEYSTDYLNAFWDGTQMVYGDGMVSDDIVGHELSHGVTQSESNLFYYYQSGAINESFSDVWGELLDQFNTSGTDTAAVKWQIGEDSPVGAFRSMSDPTLFGDPDSITSPNYDTDILFQDNGGVHHNSGVNNKAAYLMVDGGNFGGKTVTALGTNKTLAVYYEAQTNLLTSGADYADLYGALYQACLNLVGGAEEITSANCQEVRDATDAVRMNAQPSSDPNFNTDAPYCDSNLSPQAVFSDDMESGTTKWTFGATVGGNHWQLDSPAVYGPNAHSGLHSLYAYDLPATVTDTFARLKTAVSIPTGAFLRFSQTYGFEDYFFLGTFDGGVLEYSSNGGSWVDAGSLFVNNGYNGTIDPGYDNPLAGRSAFVGDSHGYISSRVDLSSLANQNVIFRWRMGLDTGGNDFGWWLDDVQIYACSSTPNTATNTPTRTATSTPTRTATNTSTVTPTATKTPITIPVVSSITRADASPTNSSTVGFIVTFSKSVTGVGISDFTLTTIGTTGSSITGVTGSGANRTVTVNTGSGNGTIRLNVIDNDSIKDAANNPLGGVGVGNGNFTSGEIYTVARPANLEVIIGGIEMPGSPYTLPVQGSIRQSYAEVNNGPVQIMSTNMVPIVASERVAYSPDGGTTWTSYSELMGLPVNQLATSYTFPWYNNVDLNSQLRFGNVGIANTTVTVTVGGVFKGAYNLIPNQSQRISYAALDSGPVKVTSSGNVPIIASMRVAYFDGSDWTSFSEMMGLPSPKLTTSYVFPWYNNVDLNSQLRFGNMGATPTTVTVTVAGVFKGNYQLAPNTSKRISYAGLDAGPVKITSSGNVPIIASMRVAYHDGSAWTDFSELMGLPSNSLSTRYSFPVYNHVNLNTQLRFANVGNAMTTVTVTIGGVLKGSYVLAPNESKRISYAGLDSGPVVIQSSGGVPIIASERVAYFNGSDWTSFSEMMGLPQSQLTTTYLFPWYNNVDLNTQLRFGVP